MGKEALLMEGESARPGTPVEKRSARTYLLLKFDDSADLIAVYRRFHLMDRVSDCIATRGDYDLILLLQADSFETINEIVEKKIMTVEGLSEAALMPVESPAILDNGNGNIPSVGKHPARDRGETGTTDDRGHGKGASSYVFLEMEKEKLESIGPALFLNDGVVCWDRTKGKFDIAMLVRDANFPEIDHMIRNKIRPLSGVLRIKELPVIQLTER